MQEYILRKKLIKPRKRPFASVIIVTFNLKLEKLMLCINALLKQTAKNFEILIVDNNEHIDLSPIENMKKINYVKLKKNFGLSLARNVGSAYSNSEILIFLDDDAIPANDFVEQHIKGHKQNIIALRGKALPITDNIYNKMSKYNNLGERQFSFIINLEGNSSFKKKYLLEIGGFEAKLSGAGGHEGLYLTKKITDIFGKNTVIYYPNAVIFHDDCTNFKKFIIKNWRHFNHWETISSKESSINKFAHSYDYLVTFNKNLGALDKLKIFLLRCFLIIEFFVFKLSYSLGLTRKIL